MSLKQTSSKPSSLLCHCNSPLLHKKMKTSVMIAGVCCLLALSFTLSECLECDDVTTPDTTLFMCNTALASDRATACGEDCRQLLDKYAEICLMEGPLRDTYTTNVDNVCNVEGGEGGEGGEDGEDDATAVGATVFSIISALVVAMTAALN